jgi:hypothetical protein
MFYLFNPVSISALLPNCLKKHDGHCRCQVQTARAVHRDRDAIVTVCLQHHFGQTFRLPAEHQKIAAPKTDVVVSASRFGREEKVSRIWSLARMQLFERIPHSHVHFVPVIESGAFQLSIFERKAERLHQVQSRSRRETESANVAGIRRNLRLDQDDVEHATNVARKIDNYNLLATNFSSFTMSAANLRMPSAVFSVAIALSFTR